MFSLSCVLSAMVTQSRGARDRISQYPARTEIESLELAGCNWQYMEDQDAVVGQTEILLVPRWSSQGRNDPRCSLRSINQSRKEALLDSHEGLTRASQCLFSCHSQFDGLSSRPLAREKNRLLTIKYTLAGKPHLSVKSMRASVKVIRRFS